MVSIEQNDLIQRLAQSPLQPLISELTSPQIGNYAQDTANATNLALNLLIAVRQNDKVQAEKFLAVFAKRQPTADSHWIYDNYVLFAIVCAVTKFSLDSTWISSVIHLSLSRATQMDKDIRETLRNILAGNFSAKNDYHQISMVYQFLAKDEHFQDEQVNKTFSALWMKSFPFYNDDFLDLLSLKAIEVAVVKKSFLTSQQRHDLTIFLPAFDRRANLLAKGFTWLILLLLIVAVFYGLVKLNGVEEKFPNLVRPILFLIGVSGVGVFGILGWRKTIVKWVRNAIDAFFQFKKMKD
ncbi:hypothetical protein [Pedobacter sp.]